MNDGQPLMLLDDGSPAAQAMNDVLKGMEGGHRTVGLVAKAELTNAGCIVAPLDLPLMEWLTAQNCEAPVVFFLEGVTLENARAAFEAGAEEVVDPAHQYPVDILRAISHARERRAVRKPPGDFSNGEAATIVPAAAQDQLTGLLNHRAFLQRVGEEVSRARRHSRDLGLAIVDIDGFAKINEQHGYPLGDEVLVTMSERLLRIARTADPVARVAADQFAWLMIETDMEGAGVAARRAGISIRTVPFGPAGQLTASIGFAVLSDAGDDVQLYQFAAAALKRAKQHGSDRIVAHEAGTLIN